MPIEDFTDRIELLVNDEKRIVSYKVLSSEFKIHVNKAKQCLLDYANTQKQRGVTLTVHYFIAGIVMKDEFRTTKVCIVPEDKIEECKKSFNEITSFHVYSVYNGSEKKDECALYSADFTYVKDKRDLTKYSAIRHPNIEIQPPVLNKIQVNNDIKSNVAKKVLPSSSVSAALSVDTKKDSVPKVVQSDTSPEKSVSAKEESASQESTVKKTSPDDQKQKPGTLMSMWQKKEDKTNGVKKENAKAGAKTKEATKPIPKNNIMSMFSKQAVKNAEKPPSVEKPPVSKDESSEKFSSEISQKEDVSKNGKPSEKKRSAQKRKASSKSSKQSSKAKQDSDSEKEFEPKVKKKHRRICTFDDSSSESEAEEEREKAQRSFFLPEDPLDTTPATPMSEDEEPIPPTPPVISVKGKAKIWKTVQKTFEDDDGFFVTKTVKEFVSEDEEEPVKAQPTKKEEAVVNKKTAFVNKKQASLMSFFKQK